jgi:hypothetical protein
MACCISLFCPDEQSDTLEEMPLLLLPPRYVGTEDKTSWALFIEAAKLHAAPGMVRSAEMDAHMKASGMVPANAKILSHSALAAFIVRKSDFGQLITPEDVALYF